MEQTRILVAIVLCFLVLLFWQMFFVDKKGNGPVIVQEDGAQQTAPIQQTQDQVLPLDEKPEPAPLVATEPVSRNPEVVTVETPLYTIRLSEKGAAVQSVKLKNCRETVEEDSDPKELVDPQNKSGTILLGFEGGSVAGIDAAIYTLQSSSETIHVADKSEKVLFRWQSKDGVLIEKTYVFSPNSYLIGIDVTVENRSTASLQDRMTLTMIDAIPENKTRMSYSGPSAMVDGKVQKIKIKKLSEKNRLGGNITWSAFQDRYFMSTIIPSQPMNMTVNYELKDETLLSSKLVLPESSIPSSTKAQYNFEAYFGPKNITTLKQMGHQLEKVVNFGMFDWLARPCLWIMNLIYRFIPNYGVAIILLTLIIKGLLWPLGNKSYKSMGQMKKMQPLMADIRERYKDDKQKMNMELMSLYKTYKVNPLGGCLPMLVQIPVLFALYRMLYQAVELRHEPFIGWIQDLSAPERLFNFGFSIPLMQAPTGIPVLTILMGASMYVQQKMQPPMGDPAQAKMMMFMPIFLIVICMNLSSGLVLYWFVSNVLSILQQYYVNKKTT